MVGKQGISERTRAKKFSKLVNAKIKSPKKVGTSSNASTGGPKGTKKKSREADDSDIVILPSSSPEPETDDGIEFLYEEKVETDDESKEGKRNGEERRATKKGVDKQNGIKLKEAEARPKKKKMKGASRPETDDGIEVLYKEKVVVEDESKKGKRNGQKSRASEKGFDKHTGTQIKEAEAKPEKKKMNDGSRRQSEGKIEDKEKIKKVEEVEKEIGAIKQRSKSKKRDKKPKGKEVEAKSPEKSNKVRERDVSKLQTEDKKDDKKMNAEGEKERTSKRQNEGEKEDKRNEKRQKTNCVEVEQQGNGANKRRDDGQKENEKQKTKVAEAGKQKNEANKRQDEGAKVEDKKHNKRQKKEVAEAEKQMNETNKKLNEGAKKKKKEENKKQKKKKVAEVQDQRSEASQQGRQGTKEEKKDKKKKNKEVEIEMEDEEENEKTNNALYKFPMSRISRIIKSADLNNKIAQEAVFVINKASEKFLELFCREAYACAFLDHKNHVAYNHLSSVVSKRRRFDFLTDFVPEKIKAEAALAEMSEMSKAETETEIET